MNGQFKWYLFVPFFLLSLLMVRYTGGTVRAILFFEKTQGVITDQEYGDNLEGNRYLRRSTINLYQHAASFQGPDGRMYQTVTKVRSNPSLFKVGDKVGIYFNPNNPSNAHIATFGELWFPSILVGFFWFIAFILWFGTWAGKPIKK